MNKQTIIDRMEARSTNLGFCAERPSVTVIAHPVSLTRSLIKPSDIYELFNRKAHIRRIAGGVCWTRIAPDDPDKDPRDNELTEFNEFGIAFRKDELRCCGDDDNEIDFDRIPYAIDELLENTSLFYKHCQYSENIEISVALKHVFGKRITEAKRIGLVDRGELPPCLDSEVLANNECAINDIGKSDNRKEIVADLLCQILWSFDVNTNNEMRKEIIKARI